MSQADAAFADMDDVLFDEFGEAVTVARGATTAPVRVVLTRGVERLGDYGQVVARVTTAMFINSEWQPAQGDLLHLATGDRKIESVIDDDGLVTTVVLHG
ncbi:head-tail joining protein [Lysobacter olei]